MLGKMLQKVTFEPWISLINGRNGDCESEVEMSVALSVLGGGERVDDLGKYFKKFPECAMLRKSWMESISSLRIE